MTLIKTKAGVILNLDQVWMIDIISDRLIFHCNGDNKHEVEKKYSPGDYERLVKKLNDTAE